MKAIMSEIEMVETIMGRNSAPTWAVSQVQSESEQDDRVLQEFFWKADTVGCTPLIMPEQRDDHAEQDGKDRAADDREGLTGQPAGNREEQAGRRLGKYCLMRSM